MGRRGDKQQTEKEGKNGLSQVPFWDLKAGCQLRGPGGPACAPEEQGQGLSLPLGTGLLNGHSTLNEGLHGRKRNNPTQPSWKYKVYPAKPLILLDNLYKTAYDIHPAGSGITSTLGGP